VIRKAWLNSGELSFTWSTLDSSVIMAAIPEFAVENIPEPLTIYQRRLAYVLRCASCKGPGHSL